MSMVHPPADAFRKKMHCLSTVPLLLIWFLAAGCLENDPRITVRVIVPPSTPAGADIFIAGSMASLGNWEPGKVRMMRVNDSIWTCLVQPEAD